MKYVKYAKFVFLPQQVLNSLNHCPIFFKLKELINIIS